MTRKRSRVERDVLALLHVDVGVCPSHIVKALDGHTKSDIYAAIVILLDMGDAEVDINWNLRLPEGGC